MLTVGIDEAGYGPIVGPLVVASVAVDGKPEKVEKLLTNCTIKIDDSKKIYQGHISNLEPIVLGLIKSPPESASILFEYFCGAPPKTFYWQDLTIPVAKTRPQPLRLPVSVYACVVTAEEFNRRINCGKNKADILWDAVSDCIRRLRDIDRSAHIICDRLGSRKDYSRLLQQKFSLAVPLPSTQDRFTYRLSNSTITFCTDGDAHFRIVGLASMVAKYLRELMMHALNRWLRKKGLTDRSINGYADRNYVRKLSVRLNRLGILSNSFIRLR